MQNLLITGGMGLSGSILSDTCLRNPISQGRVVNLDKLTYAANPESLTGYRESFPERYVFVKGDIFDRAALEAVFDDFAVDAVCHFAAESHVDRSIASPGEFINTNIVGTYNLLEIVRERSGRVGLFHHISTDEVFGSLGQEGYFTEDTPIQTKQPVLGLKSLFRSSSKGLSQNLRGPR